MTTNYHTPVQTGAAANAATFNEPLGQLDAAIGAAGEAVGAVEQSVAALQNEMDAKDFTFSNNASEFLNGQGDFAVPAGTGSTNGHTIQNDGVDLTQRAKLNFSGGLVAEDNVAGTMISLGAEDAPTWITADIFTENGWAHSSGAGGNVQYYKDRAGIVHLHGAVAGTGITAPSSILQLPVGYRNPSGHDYIVPVVANGTIAYIQVSQGSIDVFGVSGSVTVYLCGVSWPTF